MAPKQAKRAPKAIKELSVTKRPVAIRRFKKGPQAALMTVTGFVTLLAGLALALGPSLPEPVSGFLTPYAAFSVHAGWLALGGLTLVGMGLVLRRCQQLAAQAASAGADNGLLESVASNVLELGSVVESLGSSVRNLREELDVRFGGLSASLEKMLRDLTAELASANSQPDVPGSEDAIFRLAASLDKVGAKIEERLKSQFANLTERMDKVETSVGETAELTREVASRPAPMSAPMPMPMPMPMADYDRVPADPAYGARPQHQTQFHAPVEAPRGSPSGQPQPSYAAPGPHQSHHHPVPGLEQTRHYPAPSLEATQHHPQFQPGQAPQSAPPAPPADPSSLGLLDTLDDEGVRSPMPGQPPQQPSFDSLDQMSLQAPPPEAGRWDVQDGEAPLMSDPEVRSALEDLGRQGH